MTRLDRLERRKQFITDAREFNAQTRALDLRFGRPQEGRTQKFAGIDAALANSRLVAVVVGEFSRGKSSMLNALLGEPILPMAPEQTTAVNTFVQAAPLGSEPYLELHFLDGSRQRLEWSRESLERWGSELDRSHRERRMELLKIDAFSTHPLFRDNDLTVVDTPGLEGILPRHEEIARQAMNEAHVAVWVQAAWQLGGTASEWRFMRGSLSRDFRKIVTAINGWDLILEPTDSQMREVSLEARERNKLEGVRANFHKELGDTLQDRVEILTDSTHLFGVSALWALDPNPVRQERSGIRRLADALQRICCDGEMEREILLAPLERLRGIQDELRTQLADERAALSSARDLEALDQERARVETQIARLEQRCREAEEDIRTEHRHWLEKFLTRIEHEIAKPLAALADDVKADFDLEYVRDLLGTSEIGAQPVTVVLPDSVRDRVESLDRKLATQWAGLRKELEAHIRDLGARFAEKMKGGADSVRAALGVVRIELPKLDTGALRPDFGRFEQVQAERAKAQAQLEALEAEHEAQLQRLREKEQESERAEAQRRLKELELERVAREIDRLGAPPPIVYRERVTYEDAGMWKDKRPVVERVPDDSLRRDYKEERSRLDRRLANREAELQQIIEEAHRTKGTRLSQEQAALKFKREVEEERRRLNELERKTSQALEQTAKRTHDKVLKATLGRIDVARTAVEKQLTETVRSAFDAHLEMLKGLVREQYSEPLESHRAMLADVHARLSKGRTEIESRQRALDAIERDLSALIEDSGRLIAESESFYREVHVR